jgi:hypothetical protein
MGQGSRFVTAAATFRMRDVTRALKGAQAAGVEVARIEIETTGKITIVTGKPEGVQASDGNPWDEVPSHGDH